MTVLTTAFKMSILVNGHGSRCFGNRYTGWLRERVPDLEERLANVIPLTRRA